MNKDTHKTKEKIISVAAKLFARKGFISTSMSDIASEVKIEKASLYYFFKNKNDIFSAVIDSIWQGLKKDIEKIILDSKNNNVKTVLNKVIEKIIYFGLKSGLTIVDINSHKIMKTRDCKDITKRANEVKDLIVKILNQAQVKNTEIAQEIIINAVHAYVIHAQHRKQSTKPEVYANYLTNLFI